MHPVSQFVRQGLPQLSQQTRNTGCGFKRRIWQLGALSLVYTRLAITTRKYGRDDTHTAFTSLRSSILFFRARGGLDHGTHSSNFAQKSKTHVAASSLRVKTAEREFGTDGTDSVPPAISSVLRNEIRFLLIRRQSVDECRVTEVEEGVVGHLRVVEHAVQDLQLRDRFFVGVRTVGVRLIHGSRSRTSSEMAVGIQPYRSPSSPMKYGRQRLISSRQIGRTWPSAFCSSEKPHRRSISPHVTSRSSHSRRSCGKILRTNSSRSACMSRKVEETKTRMTRSWVVVVLLMESP